MKSLPIILLVFISYCCKGNAIDSLKTINDVEALLKTKAYNKKISYFDTTKPATLTKL